MKPFRQRAVKLNAELPISVTSGSHAVVHVAPHDVRTLVTIFAKYTPKGWALPGWLHNLSVGVGDERRTYP